MLTEHVGPTLHARCCSAVPKGTNPWRPLRRLLRLAWFRLSLELTVHITVLGITIPSTLSGSLHLLHSHPGHPRHWPRNSLFGTVFDPLHVILPPLGSTSHNGVASRRDELVAGAFPCRAAFAAVGLGNSRIHVRCLAVVKISIKPTAAQGSSKQECSKGISS
ncbi:hypothetical protein HaLaN_01152 [Haematococcus lacustris]|uniref:Uncharacterized protein n=1 Tax=Haematococcus lacustris TaxID=44745 RepID=A0A699Y8L5_HAELA|nr:hypothetical protein HaLaN_01152 [Haematococcus lacustris]